MNFDNIPKEFHSDITDRLFLEAFLDLRIEAKGIKDTLQFIDSVFMKRFRNTLVDYYLQNNFGYTKDFRQRIFDKFKVSTLEFMIAEAPNLQFYLDMLNETEQEKDVDNILAAFSNLMKQQSEKGALAGDDSAPLGLQVITTLTVSKALQRYVYKECNSRDMVILLTNTHIAQFYNKEWRSKVENG
ncbi:MAG TPA: hypothetical protein VK982_11470 [Bacteroidales bacterium]|nr:hypothetical protein [Bacteroidales bacterium]